MVKNSKNKFDNQVLEETCQKALEVCNTSLKGVQMQKNILLFVFVMSLIVGFVIIVYHLRSGYSSIKCCKGQVTPPVTKDTTDTEKKITMVDDLKNVTFSEISLDDEKILDTKITIKKRYVTNKKIVREENTEYISDTPHQHVSDISHHVSDTSNHVSDTSQGGSNNYFIPSQMSEEVLKSLRSKQKDSGANSIPVIPSITVINTCELSDSEAYPSTYRLGL